MTDVGLGTAPRTAMTADANLVRLLVAGLDNVIDGRGPARPCGTSPTHWIARVPTRTSDGDVDGEAWPPPTNRGLGQGGPSVAIRSASADGLHVPDRPDGGTRH